MYTSMFENSEGSVIVTGKIFCTVPILCGPYHCALHVTCFTKCSLEVSANRRRLRPFQTSGSPPRQMALTSQKALICRNVTARTWNFALGTGNDAISDLQTVAEVLPGHCWRKLIRHDALCTISPFGNIPNWHFQRSLISLSKSPRRVTIYGR
jgi:hypothetical protein